ncbi:related to lethal(2) denticleless protein [Cephalotrichum gorgonifer]|uniref:Related to lethal(2) denticleless protein n=1 Tax=Cephalotrichum gorgonifer TaxID=2041049 RepID=A0AAE8STZ8_9PEZI|nr:related to lethal(2) denticleless protein [Cephalotrichum gorgonifer]
MESQRSKTLNDFWLCSRSGVRPEETKWSPRNRLEDIDMDSEEEEDDVIQEPAIPAQPIRRFRETNLHSRLLLREYGYSSRTSRSMFRRPAPNLHPDIAAFCSRSTDVIQCNAFRNEYQLIPFSLAVTENQGKMIAAVGDEEGYVRFITRTNGELGPKYFWQAHANAIMDLDWSPTGTRLATAAGDRSARVLDVHSKSPLINLTGGHDSCLRQVKFQPGDAAGNILATSDRTSRIQIWDTRYKRSTCTIPEEVFVSPDGTVLSESTSSNFGDPINTMWSAHSRKHENNNSASVTSLQWLHPGQSHLLLSASEADATIKLWDTRYIGYTRDHKPKPLSYTAQPADHVRRPYGITSMSLNTDASRLYAVCKNGTIYTYSTSHLILGHGPELATLEPPRPKNGREAAGLGPLYGFRHDRLKVNTFFIKCSVLPSHVLGTEILAVGSSDTCPVLFPTDENAIRANWGLNSGSPSVEEAPSSSQQGDSQTPIVRNGTALTEGTSREVSSVKWTSGGDLVSLSDDYSIRFWGRDAEHARFLRGCGDFGGERFGCGWADVGADYDRDDDGGEIVDTGVEETKKKGRWW